MSNLFSEMLKKLRTERGLSQTKLGKQLFVNQSTIARWESGTRLPDAAMMALLSGALGVDVNTLLQAAAKSEESPHVIIVDDEKIILSDSLTVLDEVMPAATQRIYVAAGGNRIRQNEPGCLGGSGYRAGNSQRL